MKYYRATVLDDGQLVETLRIDERQKRVIDKLDYIIYEGSYQVIVEEEDAQIKDLTKP